MTLEEQEWYEEELRCREAEGIFFSAERLAEKFQSLAMSIVSARGKRGEEALERLLSSLEQRVEAL